MTELLRTIFFLSYDTLSIPNAMLVPATTMKTLVWGLLVFFFMLGAFSNVINTITGAPDLKGLIKRLILVVVGLSLYDYVFLKVIAFCEVLANSLGETGRIYDFINWAASHTVSDAGGGAGVLQAVATLIGTVQQALSPKMWILSLLSILILIGQPILLTIRYALLCFLYVFGPLGLMLSFFPVTRKVFTGWFTNLIQISFWIVTLRILESVIVALNVQSQAATWPAQDIVPWVLVTAIYIAFLILTPVITAKVLSGDNLGAVGTLAVGMAAAAVTAGVTGKGAIGKVIGRPTHQEKDVKTGATVNVPATGLTAVAEKTGVYARSGFAKIGEVGRRISERIRPARKEKPRR